MATTIFLVNPREGAVTPPGYLLDTYSATAAYSLRQLKTGVTSVVRVRRSSDNREENFTATEITDGTLTGFCGVGDGFVVEWIDQSGNANNVTQSVGVSQPQLVSSGAVLTLNSLPVINGDGSADYLTLSANLTALESNNFMYSFVGNNNANNLAGGIFCNRINGGTFAGWLATIDRRTNKLHTFLDEGATTKSLATLATDNTASQRLHSFSIDSSNNTEAFLNGTSQSTGSGWSVPTGGNFELMRNIAGPTYYQVGVQELIIFSSDESANRTAIETDINGYYSIY